MTWPVVALLLGTGALALGAYVAVAWLGKREEYATKAELEAENESACGQFRKVESEARMVLARLDSIEERVAKLDARTAVDVNGYLPAGLRARR